MKRFLRRIFPLLMAAAILLSIGWYLFEYDPGFTRDFLLQQARKLEDNGNHSAAVWLYNLAYDQFDGSDTVAIELAQQFKDIGNYSKAEYTLRKAMENGATPELYIALSKTYVEQGKLRDAVLLLEHADSDMQAQLAALRPELPTASVESGSYNQYLSVEIRCGNGELFVATDGDYPSAKTDAYTDPIVLQEGMTTIYAVAVADNGLVSPLAVFNYMVSDVVEAVTFTDAAFEAAVRAALGYDDEGVIYSNTLWDVTELTLPADVTSCADLKWLPNLQKLVMEDCGISDLSALSRLESLQTLTVTGTIVSTDMMAAIGGVTGLQSLTLSNCAISSVAALADLRQLRYLDLSDNAIRDISGLAAMTGLKHLDLGSNALIRLSGLEALTAIEYLDVSYNSLVSTQGIENMTRLTYLNLSSNALRSLEGVENLTGLTHFIAQYNELLEVDVLSGCQLLEYLDVSHNTLLNVNVTASLPALKELYFDHNEVSQLPKYGTSCALQIISGGYNQLSSLKNLAGLANLTHIYMDYNTEISSVNALVSCSELKEVYVYGTKVRSVSALTEKGIYVVYSPA